MNDLHLTNLPPDALNYLRACVRQDLRRMRRSHPKLEAKFGAAAMTRANARYAYVAAIYASLEAARRR